MSRPFEPRARGNSRKGALLLPTTVLVLASVLAGPALAAPATQTASTASGVRSTAASPAVKPGTMVRGKQATAARRSAMRTSARTATSGVLSAQRVKTTTPVLGPLTLTVAPTSGAVTGTFTLTTAKATTFTRVQIAVRPASDPTSTDGRLDFGTVSQVTVSGTRTFTMSTTSLPAGSYVARPTYLLNGVWVDGSTRVPFTVPSTTSPTPTPTPAPAVVGDVAGFSPGGDFPFLSGTQLDRDLAGIQATGAKWVRIDFPWSVMEPSPGVYDWTHVDRVVGAASARGLKVLALPAYTPAWARPGCGTDKCPPADPDTFARFVAEAGRRFGPDRVQAWELWNEPNIPGFWAPKPNIDAYATLLAKGAAALKAARPGAYVVSAGLSPAYTDGTNVSPIDSVKRLYALGAMRNVDAVGIHPYSAKALPLTAGTESWNTFLQMSVVHDVMVANGYGDKQVWGTEFGVATGTSAQSTTEEQQAAIITQGYSRLADGTWPWLGMLFAYSLRDHANNISDWQ